VLGSQSRQLDNDFSLKQQPNTPNPLQPRVNALRIPVEKADLQGLHAASFLSLIVTFAKTHEKSDA
jgi:hypothetical protein